MAVPGFARSAFGHCADGLRRAVRATERQPTSDPGPMGRPGIRCGCFHIARVPCKRFAPTDKALAGSDALRRHCVRICDPTGERDTIPAFPQSYKCIDNIPDLALGYRPIGRCYLVANRHAVCSSRLSTSQPLSNTVVDVVLRRGGCYGRGNGLYSRSDLGCSSRNKTKTRYEIARMGVAAHL